jgi:predicted SAM-dependent methyltransferase
MDRFEKLLQSIDKSMLGIEIGPSFNPIAPKSSGYNVLTLDHMNAEGLRAKYTGHPGVEVEKIEEVDFVWTGEPIQSLFPSNKKFDYIIASHVIEHMTDIISFFNGCSELLSDQGRLVLAVPDKRYCFDFYRERSGIGSIVDAWVRKDTLHSPGVAVDQMMLAVLNDGQGAWHAEAPVVDPSNLSKVHDLDQILSAFDEVSNSTTYMDFHRWVFTPNQFRLIIHQLFMLKMINLTEVSFYESSGCEFIISLGRGASHSHDIVKDIELASLRELYQDERWMVPPFEG